MTFPWEKPVQARTPKNVWEEAMDKAQQENRARQNSLFMLVAKDGREMLRIDENGDFTVQGRKAGNDKEILEAFRQFLIDSGHIKATKITAHCEYCPGVDKPHGPHEE